MIVLHIHDIIRYSQTKMTEKYTLYIYFILEQASVRFLDARGDEKISWVFCFVTIKVECFVGDPFPLIGKRFTKIGITHGARLFGTFPAF